MNTGFASCPRCGGGQWARWVPSVSLALTYKKRLCWGWRVFVTGLPPYYRSSGERVDRQLSFQLNAVSIRNNY
jgi:hypothetical protein